MKIQNSAAGLTAPQRDGNTGSDFAAFLKPVSRPVPVKSIPVSETVPIDVLIRLKQLMYDLITKKSVGSAEIMNKLGISEEDMEAINDGDFVVDLDFYLKMVKLAKDYSINIEDQDYIKSFINDPMMAYQSCSFYIHERYEPAEKSMLKALYLKPVQFNAVNATHNYIRAFVKERWPEYEQAVEHAWQSLPPETEAEPPAYITDVRREIAHSVVDYALRGLKGRWKSMEFAVFSSPCAALEYVRHVVQGPWQLYEDYLFTRMTEAVEMNDEAKINAIVSDMVEYSIHCKKSRSPEFETFIINSTNSNAIAKYLKAFGNE